MGAVWRARDELLNRDVAIKEIVWPDLMDPAERETVKSELAKIIAEEEREMNAAGQRISEVKALVEERKSRLADLEKERESAKANIAVDRTKLEAELETLRSSRQAKANKVPAFE